jgi:hypothetical protein
MRRWLGFVEGSLIALAGALVVVGVVEKLARELQTTVLRRAYDPWRMLDLAGILLLIVIVIELIEIRRGGARDRPRGDEAAKAGLDSQQKR